jgi:hypothetical protein
MLKSIVRSTTLVAAAVLGLTSTPAFANDNTCVSNCSRTRACEYRAKAVALTAPALPVPQGDAPVQMIDPPAVETPQAIPQPAPLPAPGTGRRRGSIRGRG